MKPWERQWEQEATRKPWERDYSSPQNAGMTHEESMQAKPVKSGGSPLDFVSGIGQGIGDIGRGIRQRAAEFGAGIGAVPPFVPSRIRSEETQIRDKRTFDPNDTQASVFGRAIGAGLPMAASMLIPSGQTLAGSTLSSATIGAGLGAVMPTTSATETAGNVTAGLLGGGLGNVASRAVLPTTARTMTQAQKELLDIANRERIPLRTSEATGSAAIKNFEQMAANRAITGGMEQRFNERQTRAINEAITRRLGNSVPELNPTTIKQFGDDIGGRVGAMVKGKNIDLTGDFFNSLVKIDAQYSQGGRLTMTPQIKSLIDDSLDAITTKGRVTGEVAQSIKSKLQDRMRDAFNAENSELGNALRQLSEGMDNAIANTMTSAEKDAWRTARRQYANYKAVEDVMTRPTREGAQGDIPVKKLASALERQFGSSYAKGTADLADVARLGQVIEPPGRSALLGAQGLPIVRNIDDLVRAVAMPPLQSAAMQKYLTGQLPAQKVLRDNAAARKLNDALLRAAGVNLGLQPFSE